MIEHLTKKGTIRLLAAIRRQALQDKKCYGKRVSRGSIDRISNKCYESATYYLDVELPVIREVISECFKD